MLAYPEKLCWRPGSIGRWKWAVLLNRRKVSDWCFFLRVLGWKFVAIRNLDCFSFTVQALEYLVRTVPVRECTSRQGKKRIRRGLEVRRPNKEGGKRRAYVRGPCPFVRNAGPPRLSTLRSCLEAIIRSYCPLLDNIPISGRILRNYRANSRRITDQHFSSPVIVSRNVGEAHGVFFWSCNHKKDWRLF